jgi:hypothetical protein
VISLFPTNVTEEILNLSLKYSDGFRLFTTTTNTIEFTWTLQGQVFGIDEKNGNTINNNVIFIAEYKAVGTNIWQPLTDEDGFWTVGSYPGAYLKLASSNQNIIRRTYRKKVALGQYNVRIKRYTFDHTENTKVSNWVLTDFDSVERDSNDYSGQRRLALRVKATEVASGQLDQISLVARTRTETWTGSQWVVAETSNPAYWFLRAARGIFDSTGRRMFGLGLADAQINLENIKEWAAFCNTNNLTINYVLDRREDSPSVMSLIAKCERSLGYKRRCCLFVKSDVLCLSNLKFRKIGVHRCMHGISLVVCIAKRCETDLWYKIVN